MEHEPSDQESLHQRLSRISTVWTVLHQAHEGSTQGAASAQQFLVQRYGPAIHRYLLAAVGDPHAADDLAQEFALSLVRGEFHGATPERGRFRNYVKSVLAHLISRYRKRQLGGPQPVPADSPQLANLAAANGDPDLAFRESWREQLLARTWEALATAQPLFFEVLQFRAAQPKLPSPQLAEELSRRLNKPFTADSARQTLHRARERFADLLLEQVAQSLEVPTPDEVEEELRDLDLAVYCQPALQRFARQG